MTPLTTIFAIILFFAVLILFGTKTEWVKKFEPVGIFVMLGSIVGGSCYVGYLFVEEAFSEDKFVNLWILLLILPPIWLFGYLPISQFFERRKYRREK